MEGTITIICELDHKEGWAPKNWCFQTVVQEKTLESLLGCKEVKSVNPKGNELWRVTGRTDAEAPTLWPPDVQSWLIRKDPDDGKYWSQKKKKRKKAKWLSEEALQIVEEKGERKAREKGKVHPTKCRVQKNSKERQEGLLQWTVHKTRGKQQKGKD